MEEVERRRGEGGIWFGKVISKDRQEQRVERWQRIVKSRYNRWFKVIKKGGIPEYLKKNWRESRWRRVIRFRLGNEMKASAYWEEEERKMCSLRGGDRNLGTCLGELQGVEERGRELEEVMESILGGEGEGEGWMRKVEREREGRDVAGRDPRIRRERRGGDMDPREDRINTERQSILKSIIARLLEEELREHGKLYD